EIEQRAITQGQASPPQPNSNTDPQTHPASKEMDRLEQDRQRSRAELAEVGWEYFEAQEPGSRDHLVYKFSESHVGKIAALGAKISTDEIPGRLLNSEDHSSFLSQEFGLFVCST